MGSCSEYKLLCFLSEGTKARASGNRSRVGDFISRTSVGKGGGTQTMLPSEVDAISSVTTDSTLWKSRAVFTETDMRRS